MVPNATVVSVGVVVVANDVAHLGHMVRVVEVGLAFIAFEVFGILINIVVIIATQQVVDAFVIMRARSAYGETARHDEVGLELVLEIGGIARLHLVVVALSKDVLGGIASNGVAFLTVGIVNGEEVVAVGVV